jgi:hypothetical protein
MSSLLLFREHNYMDALLEGEQVSLLPSPSVHVHKTNVYNTK